MRELFLIGNLPWWVIVLVACVSVALLIQQFLSLRERLSLGQSSLLVFLRACVYGLLIFFLFGPALVEKRVAKLRRPLTVLVDSSQSMTFPAATKPAQYGQPAKSRLDLVTEKLWAGEEPLIQELSRDYDLRLYRFGTTLEPITPTSISELKAQDQGTRLLEVLHSAAQEAGEQSGILLFSDGIANGDWKALEGIPSLPVPIFTIGVGDTEGFTDVRIADLRSPEFAFRGREVKLDLTVQAYGLKGKTFPLYFNRGKNLITRRSINVNADAFEQKITLSFTPKEIGPHSFSLTIPNQLGEHLTQNNHKDFKINVQRDKIRVLTLSGSPAWNYRFLRMALKQDPLMELVSFVFLRTPTDTVDVPENQLSLIPFPIDDIFLEELKNFDVVIFDDFSHRSYFNPVYLDKVRDFVRDGGGLAMFGGARAFDSGGYADTSLKDVLPVELDGKGGYQTQGVMRPVLTPSGKAHPVTRLLPDPKGNEEAWAKMPYLTTLNQVSGARGETLLSARSNGSGPTTPLLTIGRFGKGRSLALMTDEAWRWNFIAVGNRDTPQNHLKLIRQAIRWLAQEPSFEQVQIQPIATARPGEKIPIKLRVFKDDFTPTRQAAVQVRIIGPEGEPSLVQTSADAEEGEYTGEYTPTREGSYRVEAEASLEGKPLGKDGEGFSVAFPYGETDDGRPRPELLKDIAETSQGEYIPINEWNEKTLARIAARLERHAPSQIIEQRQTRLWSTLLPFAIILALLSVEWWMRRKWGLI
ncbi:MAG TPA: glutamine amidotransferase [Candidatus Binatia bacterium]|nr:glutamine amidotransferase [Candidatus Binatia bacterium]